MTTVRLLSRLVSRRAYSAGVALPVLLVLCLPSSPLAAQGPPRHWLHANVLPPGAIGAQRMLSSGPLSVYPRSAYIQPVEIVAGDAADASELDRRAPEIAIASGGGFTSPHSGRMLVGLEVGRPYRLRVTGVPLYEETDLYPTIELVSRLHPPPGKKLEFPVPIELTTRELKMAAQGAFITRVIYVENPQTATPHEQKNGQPWVEARPGDDPLLVAEQSGRPIAILRIGARGPGAAGMNPRFTFGDPPVQLYDSVRSASALSSSVDH